MANDPSMLSTEQLLAESGWLNSLARRLVGDGSAADDLVQDTFVSALRHPPRSDRPLRPWLARVARNLVRSRVRSDATRARREASHEPDREIPSAAELSEKLESQRLLVAAIGELTEPYRSTILLHYFEHLSSEEIAERQGIPAGTVRWRLKHGVDALRGRLDARTGGSSHAWIALLLPLARENAPSAAVTTSLATGVIGMSLFLKCTAAIALAIALVAGWRTVTGSPSTEIVVPSHTEPVVFEPLQDEPASVELAATNDTRREAASAAPVSSIETSSAAPHARLEARIVDETYQPISKATLRVTCGGTVVESMSDSRGAVSVELLVAPPAYVHVLATARGRAKIGRYESVATTDLVHLGDLVLLTAGAVRGVVRDRSGDPIAGARVSLDDLQLPQSELGLRFTAFVDPHREPSTATESDGTFLLEGVPVGFARLLASDRAHLPGFTGVIEVRAGEVSRGVELVLDPIPDDRILRGVLLDPDGVAIPGAYFRYRTARFNGMFVTDIDGRFETLCAAGDSFELFAEDARNRWPSVWLRDVHPGPTDVVMQFTNARTCAVQVVDPSDQPIGAYSVELWSADRGQKLQSIARRAYPAGRAEISVPSVDFWIHVDDSFHWVGVSGPLSPESVPDEVRIQLEAAPQFVGRVHAATNPIGGARVRLFEEQRQRTVLNGFPVFVEPNAIAETQSAADGSFALAVRGSGPFHVRAESDGFAPVMIGPVELGDGSIDLALTAGGVIEGSVRTAAGQSAAGVIIAFSRGDACAFTLRVEPDGVFRAEHLMPGRWMVQRVSEAMEGGSIHSATRSGRWDDIPSNCEVFEGATTHFDLDLGGGAGSSTLLGDLLVDGAAPGAWNGRLVPDVRHESAMVDLKVLVDATGRFRTVVEAHGEYRLFLVCVSGPLEGLRLGANVSLRGGETRWSLNLPTAELVLEGSASKLPPKEHFVYSVSSIPELFIAMRPLPSGEGHLTLAVPAGKGAIVRMHDETGPIPTPDLPSFDLRAGESARGQRP